MNRRSVAAGVSAVALVVAAIMGNCADGAAAETTPDDKTLRADFNGDGYDDLAVGVPAFDVGSKANAGAVAIVYGTKAGPGTRTPNWDPEPSPLPTNSQLITQNTPGIADVSETGDQFGYTVLAGRFNADRYVDLAIGVPFEDVGGVVDGGAVHILYGSPSGLKNTGSSYFTQGSPGVPGAVEPGDRFGMSLTAGDFGKSAIADLAVGVPYEDVGAKVDAGAVQILYGTGTGLTGSGSVTITQNSAGVPGAAERGDRFGASLAAGDFGKSGLADLAVGVPFEGLGRAADAGLIHVFYGSTKGLTGKGSVAISQDTPGVASSAERGDRFGSALAAGDFGKTTHADLVIGAPTEDLLGDDIDVGVIHVFYGAAAGITVTGSQYISQDTSNLPGATERGDQFGSSLAVGEFGGTRQSDLAVGTPFEDLVNLGDPRLTNPDAGGVHVLLGSPAGLDPTTAFFFCQDSLEVPSTGELGDRFATALTAGNFGGTEFDDLAVGVPFEDLDGTKVPDAGAVNLFFGSASGTMKEKLPRYLTRDNAGLGQSGSDERFGFTLGSLVGG
ncbi:MAG: FG-GAP repeat protein [Microlunatus sp.]